MSTFLPAFYEELDKDAERAARKRRAQERAREREVKKFVNLYLDSPDSPSTNPPIATSNQPSMGW